MERCRGKGKGDAKEAKSKGKGQKGQESVHKGGSKGSGKGEPQKGKGKTQPVRECYVCGKPGHLARDCWRVRQVETERNRRRSSVHPRAARQQLRGRQSRGLRKFHKNLTHQ